jgi:hypothetical protein
VFPASAPNRVNFADKSLLGMLYEKHPTIPNDKVLVQILNTKLGHFLVRAEPETKQIHIGPLTDEQAASLAGRAAELGLPATELYPEMDRQWAVQMDGRITDAWERGDERMPSENRVKKLVDDLVKRYREQLHEREFKVSPDGAAMAVLTHRSERDPDDAIRLYLTLREISPERQGRKMDHQILLAAPPRLGPGRITLFSAARF